MSNEKIIPDLGKFVDWVWDLKAERDQLKAESESLRANADRAAYWRQRTKSAEGHLYASDFQAACNALHKESNYADIPADQLTEAQKARISSAVNTVLRAVNAQRDRRRPADFVDYREALIRVINYVEGNTESLVRDLVNWGTPKVDPNEFYDECEQIKAIAANALDKEMAEQADVTDGRDNQNMTLQASNHSVD